jgi:hypothetical protein
VYEGRQQFVNVPLFVVLVKGAPDQRLTVVGGLAGDHVFLAPIHPHNHNLIRR